MQANVRIKPHVDIGDLKTKAAASAIKLPKGVAEYSLEMKIRL